MDKCLNCGGDKWKMRFGIAICKTCGLLPPCHPKDKMECSWEQLNKEVDFNSLPNVKLIKESLGW